jgi:Tc5 transposase DNA-binding domain
VLLLCLLRQSEFRHVFIITLLHAFSLYLPSFSCQEPFCRDLEDTLFDYLKRAPIVLPGNIVCEKARSLAQAIVQKHQGDSPEIQQKLHIDFLRGFRASPGWLQGFQKRHGLL